MNWQSVYGLAGARTRRQRLDVAEALVDELVLENDRLRRNCPDAAKVTDLDLRSMILKARTSE